MTIKFDKNTGLVPLLFRIISTESTDAGLYESRSF
jgi:hypothetical protein